MITKLTVPPANAYGCCDACPFLSEDGMTYCKVDLEAKQAIGTTADARPGPDCVPGEYILVPAKMRPLGAWKEDGDAKED